MVNKKGISILVPCLIFIFGISGFSQEKYDADLCITHYQIFLKPDFQANRVDLTAAVHIRNLSAKTYDRADMLCGKPGDHDDWDVEVLDVSQIEKSGKTELGLTVKTIKDPFQGKTEWPLYEIQFLRPLNPGEEAVVEFRYRLTGKKSDDGFPLHRDKATELYLISDFSWLPTMSVVYRPGKFPNFYKPGWDLRMEYPSGFVGAADGKQIKKEEKNGIVLEDWQSLTKDFPQLFIGRYAFETKQDGGYSVSMYYPQDKPVSEAARLVLDRGPRIYRTFSDLYGELESRNFNVVFSATDWGGHGLASGTVLSSRYFDVPNPSLILQTLFHEMAHSWWGSSVASFGEGSKFLREALAQFSSYWALRHLKGPHYFESLIRHQKMNNFNYYIALEGTNKQVPLIEQDGFDAQMTVAANYNKGPLIANQLRMELGDDVFFKALGTFARQFKGKTANIHDFVKTFNETAGRDLTPLFRDLCWNTGYASYKLSELRSIDLKEKFEIRVKIRNEGEIGVSCPLVLKTEAGEQRKVIRVPGKSEQEFIFAAVGAAKEATIDPEQTAFQYDPGQKYQALLTMDDSYLDDRVGENWLFFNVSYAQYLTGQYEKAAATISRQIRWMMDFWKAKSEDELLKTLQAMSQKSGYPLSPLVAAYIFMRGKYYFAFGDERKAENDIKTSLPVMAEFLYDSSSSDSYTTTGLLPQKHTPKDMESLISQLSGRTVGLEEGMSQEARKQKVQEWLSWWESEGRNQKLNLEVLRPDRRRS